MKPNQRLNQRLYTCLLALKQDEQLFTLEIFLVFKMSYPWSSYTTCKDTNLFHYLFLSLNTMDITVLMFQKHKHCKNVINKNFDYFIDGMEEMDDQDACVWFFRVISFFNYDRWSLSWWYQHKKETISIFYLNELLCQPDNPL